MLNQNRMTGISAREAEFIATMSESGVTVFSLADALRLSTDEAPSVKRLIYSLVTKRKLQRIERGKYLIIPPVAWKRGEFAEQGVVIASQLVQPYYLSYWTALNFYGWTEQPSRTIFVATIKMKAALDLQGVSFKFVKLRPTRFFGFTDRWVGPQRVRVADKEKTIVDCLDQPRYCGEIVEAVKGIWNGKKEVDFKKVIQYADRMGNGAIIKRLGYLMSALGILTPELREELKPKVTRGFVSLDPGASKSIGKYVTEWQVMVNVKPDNLMEWKTH